MAMPKYQTLVAHLEEGIVSGRWQQGQRLPPQRELAAQFGVTIATITRAVSEAARRGLVVARPGSGTFVRAAPVESPDLSPAPEGFDLRLNSVPMPAAIRAALADAMGRIARAEQPERIFGYQPTSGSAQHRAMAARWLRQRGFETSADRLLLSHGAQHGMSACLAAFSRPGDTVLCEAWTYAGFHRLATEAGLRLVGVEMDEQGMRPDALAAQLAATGATLILCSPAVQNPTMATMPLQRRRDVLAACKGTAALIIEDDVYGHLAGDEIPPLAALEPDRTIYVTSLSKVIAPGFRLGILQPPPRTRAALQDALGVQHWVAPSLYAALLAELVDTGGAALCCREHRDEMRRRLEIAAEALGPGHFTMPAVQSYHLWLPVPEPWQLDDFVRGLEQRGVRVLPSTYFSAGGTVRAPHIRACLGEATPEALRAAFTAIGHLLSERPWSLDALV